MQHMWLGRFDPLYFFIQMKYSITVDIMSLNTAFKLEKRESNDRLKPDDSKYNGASQEKNKRGRAYTSDYVTNL